MFTLIQKHYQTIANQYVSEHGHSNFTMFTYICTTDGSAWSGLQPSRITIRFSITTITTIFQMVLFLRSPEGMQHTMRLHLTVMTCPIIMSFIRFMPLIACKLIIIHPLFGLSTLEASPIYRAIGEGYTMSGKVRFNPLMAEINNLS